MRLDLKHDSNDYDSEEDSVSTDDEEDLDTSQNSSDTIAANVRFVSLEGIHSGVPTRTTATVTPTLLRNIEQTFYELTNDTSTSVPCQAGFVAPLPSFQVESSHHDQDPEYSLGSSGSSSNSSWQTPPPTVSDEIIAGSNSAPAPSKRNMGGRRPKNSSNMSPEEEAKRKVRRERNKLAAARCRKRRVDQTNELVDKVNALEREKKKLQDEISELQVSKEDLEYVLDSHRANCRLVLNERKSPLEFKHPVVAQNVLAIPEKIKVEPVDPAYDDHQPPPPKRLLLSNINPVITGSQFSMSPMNSPSALNTPTLKPNRPSSLNVITQITPYQSMGMPKNLSDIGVPITTPSNGVMFNFESLMDGGTGLTPVSQPLLPNNSLQNRNPLDLVTPTSEPSKLVNL